MEFCKIVEPIFRDTPVVEGKEGHFSTLQRPDVGRLGRRHQEEHDHSLNDNHHTTTLPGFLTEYWRMVQRKEFYVENTIRAVADAVRCVYGSQLTQWDEFMRECLVHGNVPVIISI